MSKPDAALNLPTVLLKFQRGKLIVNPIYQRQGVWKTSQKQLLIDSILRGYDIPKIYLHRKKDGTLEVIDGQQRIRAICSFLCNEFPLAKNAKPIGGIVIKNKKYTELDPRLQELLEEYNLDFVILETQDKHEICDMFFRLQNGTPLKAQEIRNAIPGKMRDFIANLAASHNFFKKKLEISDKRGNHDLIAAQMTLLAINRSKGICNIKKPDLDNMYINYDEFEEDSPAAKTVRQVLDYLDRMFPGKVMLLKKNYIVISLFILIMDLIDNYVIKGRETELYEWFKNFQTARKDEENDKEYQEYLRNISHATDSEPSLQQRHDFMKKSLLASIPDLVEKDKKRFFDEKQHQVIYHRDNCTCQECGAHVDGDAWEADHKKAWSKGGKTDIKNGQVLCKKCNAKKKDKSKEE